MFYRLPEHGTVLDWARQTPPDLKFSAKLTQIIIRKKALDVARGIEMHFAPISAQPKEHRAPVPLNFETNGSGDDSNVAALVSVCIPTYNGARWLEDTIQSALQQTHDELEVLIVDDRSTDHTVEIARSFRDSRIRVEVNEQNLGTVHNRNRCVRLSKGSLVKFLFQDDLLYPTCVEKMARLLMEHGEVGMVFAPRDVLVENPKDPASIAWRRRHGVPHTRFTSLTSVNRGIALFSQWFAKGFGENWIGEPSNVMLRKACLEKIGMFNTRMRQASDLELWARMMYFYDVGFIDETLSAFRLHSASLTAHGLQQNVHWLDRIWLVEGLLRYEEIRRTHPWIRLLRHREAVYVLMQQVMRILRREPIPVVSMLRSAGDYARYLVQATSNRLPPIHDQEFRQITGT